MIRVSAKHPCPICKKEDWCLYSEDGQVAICARVSSPRPAGEAGYLHKLSEEATYNNTRDYTLKNPMLSVHIDWDTWNNNYFKSFINSEINPPDFMDKATANLFNCGWDGACYTFPLRNANNNIIGIQRRFLDGRKRLVTGSRAGILVPIGLNLMEGQDIYICEGLSDTVSAIQLGLYAEGRMSASTGTSIFCKKYTNRSIIVVADNDEAGKKSGVNLARKLSSAGNGVRVISPKKYKDLRQLKNYEDKDSIRLDITKKVTTNEHFDLIFLDYPEDKIFY